MPKTWFPLAVGLAIAGSFALWYSLSDYERARYFGMLATIPITTFAVLGLIGIRGE